MARCSFAVDEHVPRAWVVALESNGFSVDALPRSRVGDTDDPELLEWSSANERALITNDRDFREIDQYIEHAGILLYANQSLDAGSFVRAVRRIDRQFSPSTLRNELVWIEDWL